MNSDASSRPFESYWLQIAKAVEHASDGIVIANCDRELVYINPALVNLLGYSLSDLKAVGGADAVYEDAQQLRSIRETVMQQGSWAGEALIRHRRGDRRVVFVRIDTIQSETGALVGYVALHTDITAQREAQQERNLLLQRLSAQNQNLESLIQERTRRLQQQARTLNTILESSLDHIYCVDRRCRFLYASRAGAAAMGLQPMEMIGRTPDQVELPRQLVKQLERQIRDIFTTRQPGIYQSTVSMVTGDRVFEYALSPILTEEAEVEAVVINARDITECRRNQAVLEALVAETASTVGEAFFAALVRHLAQTLGVRYATVTQQTKANLLQTIASWPRNGTDCDFSGPIIGSPCAIALQQGVYCCPEEVQQQFPACQVLQQLAVTSYFAVAILDSAGQPLGLLSVFDDKPFPYSEIVEKILHIFADRASAELERQQATQALRSSEENFRAIFEQAAVGMCRLNAAGYFVQVNQRLCDMLGYSEAELLQMCFMEITHPDDKELGLDLRQQLKTGEISTFTLEKRYLRRNNQIVWLKISVSAVSRTDTEFYSLTVAEDITAHKQAEAQLQRDEARFERIAANVPGALYQSILWPDGYQSVPYISDRIQEVLELEPEMIQQEASVLWDRVHPEDRVLLEESIAVSARRLIRWSWEGRFISALGRVVWVKGIAEPELQPDGSILWDGLLIDISRRRRAEEEIQKAIAKERELNELKSRFIATTSHEFRTPLAVIASSAGILKDFGNKLDESKKQKHLDTIQTYVRHTTQLLDDLLFINHSGTNQLAFKPESLQLLPWCHQLIKKMQAEAQQHQIQLVIDADTAEQLAHSICLDKQLLERILINLINNSVKYSPAGTAVKVQIDLQPEQISFSVEDSGHGIVEKDRAYLFEPFYRGHNADHIPGIGLGLSIVKQCVELHQGQISFVSQTGIGTTFRCSLPMTLSEKEKP